MHRRRYIGDIADGGFPILQEDERVYLNVPYMARGFAQHCRCGFDSEKKLWFTGAHNRYLDALIRLYGINGATSEKARQSITDDGARAPQ